MQLNANHADVSSYQLFAYQEGNFPASSTLWKRVGDVKALPLPMACTLTQVSFVVRNSQFSFLMFFIILYCVVFSFLKGTDTTLQFVLWTLIIELDLTVNLAVFTCHNIHNL